MSIRRRKMRKIVDVRQMQANEAESEMQRALLQLGQAERIALGHAEALQEMHASSRAALSKGDREVWMMDCAQIEIMSWRTVAIHQQKLQWQEEVATRRSTYVLTVMSLRQAEILFEAMVSDEDKYASRRQQASEDEWFLNQRTRDALRAASKVSLEIS